MENINKIQIVPDEVYEIGADKAPVIPEWSVKDDATLYEKVRKLAHSTFDRSKFTVVGSPNITDDGVANNTGAANYIKVTNLSISQDDNFKINFKFSVKNSGIKFGISTPASAIFQIWFWNNGATPPTTNTGLKINDTNVCGASSNGYRLNSTYEGYVLKNGNSYTFHYENINDNTDIYHYTGTSEEQYQINELRIGNNNDCNADIDLKQFSITVDGVPVFSGNKTGIDTIKPDDYTATSPAPTITSDGILEPYTDNTRYVNVPRSATLLASMKDHSWRMEGSFIYESSGASALVSFFTNWITQGSIGLYNSYLTAKGKYGDTNGSTSEDVSFVANYTSWTSGAKYFYSLDFNITSGQYILTLYDKDKNILKQSSPFTPTSTNKQLYNIATSTVDGAMGLNKSIGHTAYYGKNPQDLNDFKVYVEGNLVYQPCLKIPYTEGQNYVKVVDKLYRDRVKDLFEQKGYSGYYTIGEDDFTLPSNKWSDVIEHKENGLTVAEQRVDQTLTIRGACEQGVDVNLPMEFFAADSYAVFGVGTTGTNTASKFTPAADGNYIAIGKGKV